MKLRKSNNYVSRSQRRRRRIILILVITILLIAGITAAVLLLIVPQTRIINWGGGGGGSSNRGRGDPNTGNNASPSVVPSPKPGIEGDQRPVGGGGHDLDDESGKKGSDSGTLTGGSGGEGGPGGGAGENPAFPYPCSINDGTAKKATPLSAKVGVKSSSGGVYLGTSPDWSTIDPRAWSAYLGHSASIVDRFFHLDEKGILTWDVATECQNGPARLSIFQWQANLLQQMGGSIMSVTITPSPGLDKVTDGVIASITKACKEVNDLGIDMMIRFAHEMNGGWYIWGHTPSLYRSTFAKVASAVHSNCPRTAMVWAPNNGEGYPMGGGQYTPSRGDPKFAEMDTNNDGVINNKDDPYTPYYPGDEYVDWIGVSAYFYGPGPPGGWNNSPGPNVLPPDGTMESFITTPLTEFNLYQFALDHKKPFMISETSAPYHMDSDAGPGELALKQAWWRQVYNATLLDKYPNIRAINWFEYTKKEYGEMRDFTLMKSEAVRKAFQADIAATPGGLWQFGSNLVTAQGSWGRG